MPDIDMFASLADLYNTTIDELIRPGVPAEQTSPVHEKEQSIPLDAANMWQQVLQHIKPRISAPSYNTWFKHTCAEFVEGTIVVHSPNPFTMEWLSARYRSMIEEAISEVTGLTPLALSFDCAKFQYNTAP